MIRAHEAQDSGYRMHKKTSKGFPSVITIFSAPNYLDAYNNKGAILRYEDDVLNIRQFSHSPHPYWLPGFMDVFSWSMPFVAEKVAEILYVFLRCVNDQDEEAEEREREQIQRDIWITKVKSISRMLRLYSMIREERQQILGLGSLSPSGQNVPSSIKDTITRKGSTGKLVGDFVAVKRADSLNEMRPPFAKKTSLGFDKNMLAQLHNAYGSAPSSLGSGYKKTELPSYVMDDTAVVPTIHTTEEQPEKKGSHSNDME